MTAGKENPTQTASRRLFAPCTAPGFRQGRALVFSALLTTVFAGCITPFAFAQGNEPMARTSSPDLRTHFDIFAGNGKAGPYTLSFNNIKVSANAIEQPVVVVDGATLKPDNYTLDLAKGIIVFKTPLKNTSVVRVSYTYDPKVAKRNGDPASSPVTVPLMRMAGTQLKVTAMPTTGTADPKNPIKQSNGTLPLVWSMGGKMGLLGGGLSSNFNYAGNDSLGMQLGYNLGNARNGLDLQFSKADREFATRFGKNFGMTEAAQRRVLGARLAPMRWMGASFSSTESRDLVGKGMKEQNVYGLRLVGAGSLPTLAFNRTEDNTVAANRQETSVLTDKLDLTAKLTKTMSVTAVGVRTALDAPGGDVSDTTNEDMTINFTAMSPNQQSRADVMFNRGGKDAKTAEEDRQAVTLRLQPAPVFVITAERRDHTVTPIAADGTEGRPHTVQSQSAGAEMMPVPGAKLTTSVQATTTNDVKVSATNIGATVAFGGMVNGAKTLEITTGLVNRSTEVVGQDALDTLQTRFALRASKALMFSGGVTWNPEHKGVVSQAQRQELNVNARIGSLELVSGYAITTLNGVKDYDNLDPQFGQVSLTLGLQVNRFTRLNGSYMDSLNWRSARGLPVALVPHYLKSYGLGFTHTPGGDFSLSFGGTITENRAQVKNPTDIKAEAKIGVKF